MNLRTGKNGNLGAAKSNALKIDASFMNEDFPPEDDDDDGERDEQQFHTVDYDDILAANLNNQAKGNNTGANKGGRWLSNILSNTRRSSKKSFGDGSQNFATTQERTTGQYADRAM